MNHFTKEELFEILDYCNWDPPALGHSDFRKNLWIKIKSMIDKYYEHEEIATSDMKENQVISTFTENGKTYLTVTSDIFAYAPHAALNMAHKIIALILIGNSKFSDEWIDRIILRLQELKNDNQ